VDRVTPKVRSRIMSSIRSRDTGPELAVRAALSKEGVDFEVNVGGLPGSPDIVLRGRRIAVFVDGDFWHGRLRVPKSNGTFWRRKFEANAARDRRADRALRRAGWSVLRVWESDIRRGLPGCVGRILKKMGERSLL
jgi:DNA mismatch endonuclease (patch repair protein)